MCFLTKTVRVVVEKNTCCRVWCVGMTALFLVTKVDICFDRLTYDSYD